MPVRALNEPVVRAAVSVTQMAKMVGLSRAAFYDHVRRGTFFPPEYSNGATRRPIFTAELQRKNLVVKATNLGANGDYVLFYDRQPRESGEQSDGRSRRSSSAKASSDLRRRLEGLGMSNLTDDQVAVAYAACFPNGTAGVTESDMLRVIYRHLRRPNSA